MFQPDKDQWEVIAVGFFVTVVAWVIWEGRTYPPHMDERVLGGLGRFFVPIGTALYVWYLESKKGKKP